jgi:ADP-L-glycero-D-manno-heptose 6-epimerase
MTDVLLVTGSSGFVGRNLMSALKAKYLVVEGFDNNYLRVNDWKNSLIEKLNNLNPSTIFHVGACSNTLEQNVQYMMIHNYESTKVITDWCLLHNREIIYSSSAANYGESGLYPSNLYGWSKYVAEDYVTKSGGLALRYFNIYGPGEEDKGIMASFLYQAYLKNKSTKKIYLFPGNPLRDFVYINDVLSANLYAKQNFSELRGRYFEVSTGVASSFEEVLEIFGLPYEYSGIEQIPPGYQFYTCGDSTKWMKGWNPSYNLNKGIAEYKSYLEEVVKR